jgi:CRISPR/Cas system-associated exonuclease Cas4 (RecB family)
MQHNPANLGGTRVITGRPSALRSALAARVGELRGRDPLAPITVLVGASLQRPYLARSLAAALGGHANLRILMPGDLALLLGAPALVEAGRRALPPLADRILLAEVARSDDGYFAPVAETPGLTEALYRLVRELRGAGYDLADLAGPLEGVTDAPEKAVALARILARFEARRARFYGPDDALLAADPSRLDGLGLLVWGALDMPPALEALIVRISERMPVDVFLPDIRPVDDAPLGALRARLVAAGAETHSAPESEEQSTALAQVRARLFATPAAPPIAPDGAIRAVSAPDPAREVRAAARACLAWAAEGMPFWEMAVAYRHGDAYRPLVEAVFIEAGIPLYLHEGSPLAERPVGRQTLALLGLYETDVSRQSVMDFLTDARLPDELHRDFDGVPATRWDSISRRAGIVTGVDQWASRLALLGAELAGDDDGEPPEWVKERIADVAALARFIADLSARLTDHPDRAPWAAHLDFLDGLLSRYVRGANEIVEALRGLERFTALEEVVDFDRFLEVVRRAVETLRSEDVLEGRAGAFARRGVNVVAVNSLPGIEFAAVWVLGATERSFPPPARQDPILLDSERALLSARAPAPLAPRADRGSEEALQFALACAAARERLVVSYARRATGENRPRLPSVFFREVVSQLAGERVSAERAPLVRRPDVERIPGDAIGAPIPGGRNAADPRVVHDAAAGATSETERDRTYLQAAVTQPLAIATFERAVPAFARARIAERARRSGRYSEWDGALGPRAVEAIAALVPPDFAYAPTVLEDYAACPQRFLMSRLLRVKAIEEPERTVRIDALHRGSLVHRILERFHAEWDGPGTAASATEGATRMRAIAEEECDAAQARGETGYAAMWTADRLQVIDDCLRWLDVERSDPTTAALPVGTCETPFATEIMLDGLRLRLRGRIDRMMWDEARTRFRVVDYKTGRVRDEKSGRLLGGRMLQLALYVLAGAELLGIDASAGEAAYVYPTRRGEFRSVEWTGAQLAERRAELTGLLETIVAGIARGDFPVAPWKHDDACKYCTFDPVCPRPRKGYVERRLGDERLQQFAERVRSVE